MWSKGIITIEGVEIQYFVKHFEEGSRFGIDGGKISKLQLKASGKTIVNYDRDWDIEPKTKLAHKAYTAVMKMF